MSRREEKNLEEKYSIEFLPFGLGLKELDRFDVVILCTHLKVELDKALKNQTINKPLYLLPPKMYGLMKFDEIIVDIEDVMNSQVNIIYFVLQEALLIAMFILQNRESCLSR